MQKAVRLFSLVFFFFFRETISTDSFWECFYELLAVKALMTCRRYEVAARLVPISHLSSSRPRPVDPPAILMAGASKFRLRRLICGECVCAGQGTAGQGRAGQGRAGGRAHLKILS